PRPRPRSPLHRGTEASGDLLHSPVDGALADPIPLELEDLHGEARIGAEHVQLAVQDEDPVAVLQHGVDLEAQPGESLERRGGQGADRRLPSDATTRVEAECENARAAEDRVL